MERVCLVCRQPLEEALVHWHGLDELECTWEKKSKISELFPSLFHGWNYNHEGVGDDREHHSSLETLEELRNHLTQA